MLFGGVWIIGGQRRTQGERHGGLAPNGCIIVHNNKIIVSGEAIEVLKIVENFWAVRSGQMKNPVHALSRLARIDERCFSTSSSMYFLIMEMNFVIDLLRIVG